MFYAMNPTSQARVNRGSTANGYGHWFDESGAVSAYANGYLYSEFSPSSLSFTVGQYPGKLTAGKDYTIGQILRYKQSADKEALARFIFRVHVTGNSEYGAELASVEYTDPRTLGIEETKPQASNLKPQIIYNLQGRRLSTPQKGINIINGRKRLVK
jgi:hypothetical protein